MKKTWKKCMSILMAGLLLALTASGCAGGNSQAPSGGTDSRNQEAGEQNQEPVTLVVGVKAPSSAYQGPWEELDWIKQIQEASGISLEFKVYSSNEDVNLMFTSRDYPDISFNVGNDKQIQDAALGGDVYRLDELIEDYSPNWTAYFEKNPYARKASAMGDGHIYSLPIIRDEPSNCNLRDQWLINKEWLDELNLPVPKTTEEFYEALKAFKDNAGKGTIPENVIPYYIYGVMNNVGGALDMINSFGVRVSGETYLVTVDDNGKVEFNYVNEAIKEPLSYLHKLFLEGLIPGECLTDDNETYLSKTRSQPYVVGSYHSYQNPDASNTKIVAMGPLDAENGKTPLSRSQTNQVTRNCFTIYSNCKNPEAAMKLADLIADPDWSIQAMYGMYGDTYLQKNEDGSVVMHPYEADAQGKTSAPMNRVPFILSKEMFDHFTYAEGSAQRQRADAIAEQYSKYTIPLSNLYPKTVFTAEQTDRLAELKKDINDYTASTFSKWLLEGGIEEEWDGYVNQVNKLGLEEYLQILQEALDSFNEN